MYRSTPTQRVPTCNITSTARNTASTTRNPASATPGSASASLVAAPIAATPGHNIANSQSTPAPAPNPSPYLTNTEAASFLKLSPRTLEKQRVHGTGPRFRKFGRRVLYAIDDLTAWANARACASTSDATYQSLTEPPAEPHR